MEEIKAFKADDGKLFLDKKQCNAHELKTSLDAAINLFVCLDCWEKMINKGEVPSHAKDAIDNLIAALYDARDMCG